ncbi:hypothetical protein CPB84DRAFT_1748811 [Gymnopilus junonius]|uniref:Uncharacterized protein n=1 Tax=Gymnopilus junonius TaxID=109634 RepID=A0A9P5NL17_GYMJU|nr:hypothetical protein CPB84DRAFT_1748811 [Gymnopilus junonius]
MLRAGLVYLVLFLTFVGLASSAPIPERLSTLVERYDDFNTDFFARSLAILVDRDFDGVDPILSKFPSIADLTIRGTCRVIDTDPARLQLLLYDERDLDKIEYGYGRYLDEDTRRLQAAFHKVKEGFQKFGHIMKKGFQKVGQGLKKFGGMVKSGFQKAGHAIKSGFQKAGHAITSKGGHAIKKGFQIAGHAIKKGFQKVGQFIKTTGAKIAKFGLKIVAAVASVAAKVIKFIPGIGTAASMGLKGLAIGASKASDKIHANLGSKLEKATHGMDYVINPMGSAAKKMGAGGVVANLLTKRRTY